MRINALWLSASVLTLGWCGAAAAQTAPDQSATASDATQSAEEIVVTAERRTENLQTAPLAATVLTGDDLAERGVTTVDGLQFISPAATVNNFGQGIDFNIRGIGKAEHNTPNHDRRHHLSRRRRHLPRLFHAEPYYDIARSRCCAARKARSSARTRPAARCSSPPTIPSSAAAITATSPAKSATTTTSARKARSTCRSATRSRRASRSTPNRATASTTSPAVQAARL